MMVSQVREAAKGLLPSAQARFLSAKEAWDGLRNPDTSEDVIMQRFFLAILGCVVVAAGAGAPLRAMPIQPVKVTLWDIPNGNQIRGTASFQGLPKGVAVQVSLRVASYGPDAALIGAGTCTAYKKVYALKPAIKGLSNTVLPSANMITLFKAPHVVVLPRDKYCGVLKSAFSH